MQHKANRQRGTIALLYGVILTKEWCVTCQISRVACHVAHVTCHMSHATCRMPTNCRDDTRRLHHVGYSLLHDVLLEVFQHRVDAVFNAVSQSEHQL